MLRLKTKMHEPQPAKANTLKKGEERFAAISDTELNVLLESHHSKATKTATNWAVSTFKST